jgi:prevent-host-death family protein
MADLRARELRNDLGRVLKRVQAGERLRVTLRGTPVADLVPVAARPTTMRLPLFLREVARSGADASLAADLEQAVPGDTDDVV